MLDQRLSEGSEGLKVKEGSASKDKSEPDTKNTDEKHAEDASTSGKEVKP